MISFDCLQWCTTAASVHCCTFTSTGFSCEAKPDFAERRTFARLNKAIE